MNRRAVIALSTTGVLLSGTVGYIVWPGDSAATQAEAGPRPGQVRTVPLRTAPSDREPPQTQAPRSPKAPPAPAASPVAELPAARTGPFSMVGVSWDDPGAKLHGSVQVRTRGAASGRWSPWRTLQIDDHDAPDAGSSAERPRRGATKPLWVGPSNGVQIRVTGSGPPPAGLRAELVDPGDGPRVPQSGPGSGEQPGGAAGQSAGAAAAPAPVIVTRAQWGADESLVTGSPQYAPAAKVVFTHHSAGGNDYDCAESPAVIRSILLYHVKTNGWNDIGYNFLVDKCGTIFEGRKGGVGKPVIGAHTYGYNTGSAGVAVLGDFTGVAPSVAAQKAVARVAAWKLGLHGSDPTGRATVAGKSFNTISGHRDGVATACPGELLYGRLGAIRSHAKQWSTPAKPPIVTSITGATESKGTYYTRGTLTIGWNPAAVSTYEVLLNGKVLARRNGRATWAQVKVPEGAHKLRVRARNLNGTTALSPVYPVISDVTAPVFRTAPALRVRGGAVGAKGKMPVRLTWKVTDNVRLRSLRATSPTARNFKVSATAWATSVKPGVSRKWTLLAADTLGNNTRASITRTAALVHDQSAVRRGRWKVLTTKSYLGRRALYSKTKGASVRYAFTGRSVGLIFRRGTANGAVHIYVDGVKVATVDTKARSTRYRRIVWTKSWKRPGRHTVRIVVAGTKGRPAVVTDGIAVIR